MIYEFLDTRTDELVELDFPMGKAPRIGDEVEHEGRTLRRIVRSESLQINGDPVSGRYPVESRSIPRGIKGCKRSKRGLPIIENKKHADRICKEQGLIKE